VGLAVVHVSVNEDDGITEFNCNLVTEWTDEKLAWDPSKFGGLKSMRMPVTDIFVPDIGIERSGTQPLADKFTQAVVDYKGRVMYIPQRTYRLQAEKKGDGYFQLTARMGSWTYDKTRMTLKLMQESLMMEEFTQGPKWDVSCGGVTLIERPYEFMDFKETFPLACFVIDIKKKA